MAEKSETPEIKNIATNRAARHNYTLTDTFEAGIPESFNVLVKEMRSLGLNVELLEGEPEPAEEGADT